MNVIKQTVETAFHDLVSNYSAWLVPAGSIYLVSAAILYIPIENEIFANFINSMWFLAHALIAIFVHEHIIQSRSENRFKSVIFYTIWLLLISLPFLLLTGIHFLGALAGAFAILVYLWILYIPAIYVTARYSLVLPDRAVGRDTKIKEIWSFSNTNGWKLTFVLLLPPLVLALAMGVFLALFPETITRVFGLPIGFLMWVFEVALLSVAYKDLRAIYGKSA